MRILEEAIKQRGKAIDKDVLLVDSFLNHQIDVGLMQMIGEEFASYFAPKAIDRIVTIESSGIAPAAFTAYALNVPLVVMKKQTSKITTGAQLSTTVHSFTKGTEYQLTVKKEFLPQGERVLFIDDFLASGEAAFGALKLFDQANAQIAGIGIVIEKSFQPGAERLKRAGIDLYSLARVQSMENGVISFIES